jgi:hypothetical protein
MSFRRRKRSEGEPTWRERLAEFGDRLNAAHRDRPRSPHAMMSPFPEDPGGFSRGRRDELDAELKREGKEPPKVGE